MMNIILLSCFAMLLSPPASEKVGANLTIRFEGIDKTGGTVRLAMYNSRADFMVESKAVLYNFRVDKNGTLQGAIENLPAGSYGFAVFFDDNNNNKLDKNLLGVPTELYSFSKDPPSKWRLPTWEEVKFEHGQSDKLLVVNLKRWALL